MKKLAIIAVLALLSVLSHAQQQHGVTLNWTQTPSPVASDNVYSSTTSGGPYTKIFSSSAPITTYFLPLTNANSGIKTFFVTSAVGTDGVESGWSNEVSATFLVLTQPNSALSATSQ